MLDFRVETFLTVCKHLNYTRAAAELNITQPAVTQHIHYLQDYYGVKLFEYHDKRLTITKEGAYLRNTSMSMLHDEEKLKRDLRDMQVGRQSMRFGATLTIGEYALPEKLASYKKRHPEVDVHMVVDNTQALLASLNAGRLDFAFVEGYFMKGEYDSILWSREPYICICGPHYPLERRNFKLEELLLEDLIVRNPGSGSREVLVRVLEEMNFQLSDFSHVMEISDLHVIKELVKADCGITFLYQKAVEKELREGTIRQVELSDFHISHEFTFLWRKNSAFEEDFRRVFRELTGTSDR